MWKPFLIVCVVVLVTVTHTRQAAAESAQPSSPFLGLQTRLFPNGFQEQREPDVLLRRHGIALTAAGALMFLGGLTAVLQGSQGLACNGQACSMTVPGSASVIASVPMLLVGIPFWARGSWASERLSDKQRLPFAVSPMIDPTAGGAVAGVRVTYF